MTVAGGDVGPPMGPQLKISSSAIDGLAPVDAPEDVAEEDVVEDTVAVTLLAERFETIDGIRSR